jgi:hypothetical protein
MTIEMITGNPWFSFISLAVTVISLVAAFIFYRKSRREKTPCYGVIRQSIIENSAPLLPGLSVHFNGIVQEAITVAKVAFWNCGNETIVHQDVAEAKPLTIIVEKGVDVLGATVLKRTDSANQFQISEPQKQKDGSTSIPFGFDFLDSGDGGLVQVVHNGGQMTRVWVDGRIKGFHGNMQQYSPRPNQRVVASTMRVIRSRVLNAVVVLLYLIIGVMLISRNIHDALVSPGIFFGVACVLISLFAFVVFFLGRKVPIGISPNDEETPSKVRNRGNQ